MGSEFKQWQSFAMLYQRYVAYLNAVLEDIKIESTKIIGSQHAAIQTSPLITKLSKLMSLEIVNSMPNIIAHEYQPLC
jgi:hypothetical protein